MGSLTTPVTPLRWAAKRHFLLFGRWRHLVTQDMVGQAGCRKEERRNWSVQFSPASLWLRWCCESASWHAELCHICLLAASWKARYILSRVAFPQIEKRWEKPEAAGMKWFLLKDWLPEPACMHWWQSGSTVEGSRMGMADRLRRSS